MMINAEEEKQLLNQLGVVGSAQGTHYQQTVEFGMLAQTHSCIFTGLDAPTTVTKLQSCFSYFLLYFHSSKWIGPVNHLTLQHTNTQNEIKSGRQLTRTLLQMHDVNRLISERR